MGRHGGAVGPKRTGLSCLPAGAASIEKCVVPLQPYGKAISAETWCGVGLPGLLEWMRWNGWPANGIGRHVRAVGANELGTAWPACLPATASSKCDAVDWSVVNSDAGRCRSG
jgi:hypothetical protein